MYYVRKSLFGSKASAAYWKHLTARFDGVHAFWYNSAESEPIWMKSGAKFSRKGRFSKYRQKIETFSTSCDFRPPYNSAVITDRRKFVTKITLVSIFRSSPGDNLIDWNSGVSVRPFVRTSTKSLSDFHLIWYVARPRPRMRTAETYTRSKVKVKVTELPKLRKFHYSRSISSTVLAWSSKLMVDVIVWDLDYSWSQSDFRISF